MGDRHVYDSSQTFESNHAQSWNNAHVEQPNMHLARGSAVDNAAYFYPMENGMANGVHYASHWNGPRSNEYVPLGHNDVSPQCQPNVPRASQDPFGGTSNIGTFRAMPENYACHASSSSSSSSFGGHGLYAVDSGSLDMTMDSGRGHHKRKSPVVPTLTERGSSSRYYSVGSGSSSAPSASSDLRLDESDVDSLHRPWEHLVANGDYNFNGSNIFPIRGEASLRNVRSCFGIDSEANIPRAPLSVNHNNFIYTSHPIEHPSSVDHPGQSSNGLSCEWSHTTTPAHGRISISGGYRDEPNHQSFSGSNIGGAPLGAGDSDFASRRRPLVRQGHHGSSSQPLRSVRSMCSQRSGRDPRSSLSSIRMSNIGPSEQRPPSVADGYPRHSRPLSTVGWQNSDGARRSRVSSDRFRSFPEEGSGSDHFDYEGFMIVERSGFYASRSMFDEHRDLRLDVDNMSYEELLALGERIGSVNTGLSEDSIVKCLTEAMPCSSEKLQDQSRCVICLEEYQNADNVGAIKNCGHDYHVDCIRKWLSMKNSCPICKAPALDDGMKHN